MAIFALVDCNNFYTTCETVFCPWMAGRPVVVLSNNDGNVVSRSQEAKALGIPMGAPFFQWKPFFKKHGVVVRSTNPEFFVDMSRRVMNVLLHFCPDVEVYSVDEAFLKLDGLSHHDLLQYLHEVRLTILKWTGITVSIGLAPTKTLAKVANKIAKQQALGVCDLREAKNREKVLAQFPIEDIWGIGRQLTKHLYADQVHTAQQLRDLDQKTLRRKFSVVMERLILELRGFSCLPLEVVPPRQQIMSSRSFGHPVTRLQELAEAVSHFTARACYKLRRQNSCAHGIYVYLQTNLFQVQQERYINGTTIVFPQPSQDTGYIIQQAKTCLQAIYRPSFRYHKAGIMLLEVGPDHVCQFDLLTSMMSEKKMKLMQVVDGINERMGEKTIFHAAQGIKQQWTLRADYPSRRYTTRWNELPITK